MATPEQRPVAWGIVGYGWVARDYMAPGIRAAGHRLVAVADPGAASARRPRPRARGPMRPSPTL